MATKKKTVKKTAKKLNNVLTFNKANAKLFADNIFSNNKGRITFLKLCSGELSNGKDGGRTLHCALGEAYFTFVDPYVAKFVNQTVKKFGEDVSDNTYSDSEENVFNPKYSDVGYTSNHIPTLAVVDALVDAAQLRSKDVNTKKLFAQALLSTMESNDDTCGVDIADDLHRSMNVAETWRSRVIPLLK